MLSCSLDSVSLKTLHTLPETNYHALFQNKKWHSLTLTYTDLSHTMFQMSIFVAHIILKEQSKSETFLFFHNIPSFYGEELLAHYPNPKLENHPLSAVHQCLFNTFSATLHIWRPFPSTT
jgi:hypothetical protein